MDNVENQYIIHLYTNYCYCINIVVILVLLLFCTDTDIGKNYHIGRQYFSRSNYWYTSNGNNDKLQIKYRSDGLDCVTVRRRFGPRDAFWHA